MGSGFALDKWRSWDGAGVFLGRQSLNTFRDVFLSSIGVSAS